MLLREQVKLLKGQNKKLKKENREFRHKLQDDGEWDDPISSSTSQSESISSCVVSPRDSPPSSKDSSRVPSESPSHHEETMTSSSSMERTRLRQLLSPSAANSNVNKSEGGVAKVKSEEKSLAVGTAERDIEQREVDNDEIRDVPGSLPSSSGMGIGASTMAGSQNGRSVPTTFTSKSKPIPIPRSTTLSVGGASDVMKANESKVTHGFLMRVQSLDSVPSSSVKTVQLESFVPKPENPIPKPRVITNRSQVTTDGGDSPCMQRSSDSNKVKEKEKSQTEIERPDNSNEVREERDSNKVEDEKILTARKLLENVLPHLSSQRPTKPTILPRSMSTREDEGAKIVVPLLQRATSTSPIGKVGTVTLGDESPVLLEKQPGNAEKIDEDGIGKDERAASTTSSNKSFASSMGSGNRTSPSAITKPLPPPPSVSSATKPLPSTPSASVPKPFPPTPSPSSSSATKPLPPTPSSSVPKPLPPTPSPPSSSLATKPLPLKPIKMSTSAPSSPPPSALATVGGGKDNSGSISPKTPTTRTVAGYKKVTIQSDTSWINRKKESGHECTDHPLETSTKSTGSAGESVTTPTSVQSPGGVNRPHAPYRSHPILPVPSSGSSGSKTSLLSPGVSYGGPMELKSGK